MASVSSAAKFWSENLFWILGAHRAPYKKKTRPRKTRKGTKKKRGVFTLLDRPGRKRRKNPRAESAREYQKDLGAAAVGRVEVPEGSLAC